MIPIDGGVYRNPLGFSWLPRFGGYRLQSCWLVEVLWLWWRAQIHDRAGGT